MMWFCNDNKVTVVDDELAVEVAPSPKIERVGLEIRLRGDRYFAWNRPFSEKCPVGQWRDFLSWFHGRPQSEVFVMRIGTPKAGCDAVLRKEIISYSIRVLESE